MLSRLGPTADIPILKRHVPHYARLIACGMAHNWADQEGSPNRCSTEDISRGRGPAPMEMMAKADFDRVRSGVLRL